MFMVKSIRIADTTKQEREQIVAQSIGNIDGLCDGCGLGIIAMYDDYIEGRKELVDINREFCSAYTKADAASDRSGCAAGMQNPERSSDAY